MKRATDHQCGIYSDPVSSTLRAIEGTRSEDVLGFDKGRNWRRTSWGCVMRSIRVTWVRGMAAVVLLVANPTALWAGVGLQGAGIAPDPTPPPPPPPQTGLLPISPLRQPALPAGSVLCGIDSIFGDGFEPASFTPIGQVGGGIPSPGLIQDIVGSGATSVTITSPVGSPSTGDSAVDVAGTFVGPVNTGVTVNGVPGATVNGYFLVPNVPLIAGTNTLTVQAMTLPGATATASGAITQSGSASPTAMLADHAVGYGPFIVTFSYVVGTLPSGLPVQSVAINFKGNGPDDYTGSLAGAPTSFTYTQPGFYSAQFRVTDTGSHTFTATRAILFQDLAAQRGMLCDVYGYLHDRLTAQDAANAANAYQSVARNAYLALFNQLGTNMPAVALQLGVIVDGQLGTGFAELLLARDNPDQTRNGFPIRMTQGTDGVWRISEM